MARVASPAVRQAKMDPVVRDRLLRAMSRLGAEDGGDAMGLHHL